MRVLAANARPIAVFVVGKALAVAALIAGFVFNFAPDNSWNYYAFTAEEAGVLLAFINWDGQNYIRLAVAGYPVPAGHWTAFYPLFPALIAGGMRLGLGPIAAGLALATLCSALALLLLERLLPREERGPSSLWLLACFPTAFYMSVVYTESLFIAALAGLLWSLREPRRAGWAALCAALMPLARGHGLWLVIPIAAAWVFKGADRRSLAAASAGYALGVALYLGFFWWRYDDAFAGFAAQAYFVSRNSLANLLDLPRFIVFMLEPPDRFLWPVNSGLDKAMIAFSLLALAAGVRLSPNAFVAALWISFALLPAMMGEGSSYARYALLAWVCFVLAAGPALRPWAKWAIIVPGFGLQIYLAWCFGGNRWVG